VASLKLRGLTAREIQAILAQAMINVETGEPYGLGTIGRDLVALKKQWKEAAKADIAKHIARELAELTEHRRAAWAGKELDEVRQGLALEMKLLGTQAPEKTNITGDLTITKVIGGVDLDKV